jgi:hypothetical protein
LTHAAENTSGAQATATFFQANSDRVSLTVEISPKSADVGGPTAAAIGIRLPKILNRGKVRSSIDRVVVDFRWGVFAITLSDKG